MGGTSSARDLLSACGTRDIRCASCAYDHINVGSTHDLRSACVGFGADDSIGERASTDNLCHASYDLRCASDDLRSTCGSDDIRGTSSAHDLRSACGTRDIRCASCAYDLINNGSTHDLRSACVGSG